MNHQSAFFFDRDGTLIEEVDYLVRAEQIRIFPVAFEAIRRVNQHGILAVVVTNQSGIARGFLSEMELERIHRRLHSYFSLEGARLDAFYYCPHHPEAGDGPLTQDCSCRKPKPGMLLQAAGDLELNLSRSVMIGDTLADVEAGHRAGTTSVLVRTGYGKGVASRLAGNQEPPELLRYPDYIASDILQAVDWSLERICEKPAE